MLCLGGCASSSYPTTLVPVVPDRTAAPELYRPIVEPEYRISVGDALLVQSYYDPALKQEVRVRPDGRVSLLLIGEVDTEGKTVRELTASISKAYAKLLDHPDITAAVEDIAGLQVYVGGEVKAPSVQPLKGDLTLMQSIMQAGGFLASANQEQVIILRQDAEGRFHAMQQDVTKVLRNEAGEIYLKRHDIIFVPQTYIAAIDQYVEQHVNEVLPRALNLTFGYQFLSSQGNNGAVVTTTTTAPAAAH
jgi:protein involved in polysaccharide export with SLBB domain